MRERVASWLGGLWRQKAWLIVLFLYKLGEDRVLAAVNGFVDAVIGGAIAQDVDRLLDVIPTLTWLLIPLAIVVILVHAYFDTRALRPINVPDMRQEPVRDTEPTQPEAAPVQPEPRVFVPPSVTPQFLIEFFEGKTDAQGKRSVADHLGKWMPVNEAVSNVQVFSTSAVVTCYVEATRMTLPISIGMWFPEKSKDSVALLNSGDEIAVVGRIARVARSEVELQDCERTDI